MNDKEALAGIVRDHFRDVVVYDVVDAILNAGFSRTAVPDAATEGSDVCNHAITYDGSRWICRRCEATPRSEFERDAALAAIERVRALAYGNFKGQEDLPVDRYALKAALDGGKTNE